MYKKIAFILITSFPKNYLYTQSIILLLLIGITFFMTRMKTPFLIPSINNLENSSNLSAFLIILVGNLLLFEVSGNFKVILGILLMISSLFFLILWARSTFDILLKQNSDVLISKCLRFYAFYYTANKWIHKFRKRKIKLISIFDDFKQIYNEQREKLSLQLSESKLKSDSLQKGKGKKKKILEKAIKFLNEI